MSLIRRIFGIRDEKPVRIRPGNFICDRHWAEVVDSWGGNDPIDPVGVTLGLAIACHLVGIPEGTPVEAACCRINKKGWDGVVARSRPSWYKAAA